MKVLMCNSGYDGCSYVRIYLPAVHNGFRLDRNTRANNEKHDMARVKNQMDWADVVVFHRPEQRTNHEFAKMLKKRGKKIVIDNDDTFKIDDFHPLACFTPDAILQENVNKRKAAIDDFIKIADLTTTSTKFLAEEYKKITDKVVVLPNYIDPEDWPEPERSEGKVRIGIVGSAAMIYDIFHLKEVLDELNKRPDVELWMFGLGDSEHKKNNPEVTKVFKPDYDFWDSYTINQIPWCKNYLYQETLNSAKLDLMLIPRRDNYFNRCKSNLKFLEASMLEIPVIAQSFENSPYEEISPDMGVLIRDNNKWMEEIDRLINNKSLRKEMGKTAKQYVLKNYNIENNYLKWRDAYKKLYENT